jgi:hypothetical protein
MVKRRGCTQRVHGLITSVFERKLPRPYPGRTPVSRQENASNKNLKTGSDSIRNEKGFGIAREP